MSRFFPHTAYAEDQPLARTILTTHVLTRGATSGALVGLGLFGARTLRNRFRGTSAPLVVRAADASTLALLRHMGVGTAWGVGFLALGVVGRMWGREEIEWKDRSWRLLENAGQLETDDWSYGGAALGVVGAMVASRRRRGGAGAGVTWRILVGGAGAGSVVGMLGYMGWRYGIHGGRFLEAGVNRS